MTTSLARPNSGGLPETYTLSNPVHAVRDGMDAAKIAAAVVAACNGLENSSVQAETSGDSGKVIFSLTPQGKLQLF